MSSVWVNFVHTNHSVLPYPHGEYTAAEKERKHGQGRRKPGWRFSEKILPEPFTGIHGSTLSPAGERRTDFFPLRGTPAFISLGGRGSVAPFSKGEMELREWTTGRKDGLVRRGQSHRKAFLSGKKKISGFSLPVRLPRTLSAAF